MTVELAPDVLRIARRRRNRSRPNGPTTSSRPCPRPRACSASARPAVRCSHGSRFATGSLADAIDDRSLPVDRSGRGERRMRAKVIVWSLVATASLVGVAVWGVPRIATRLTPLIPYAVERRLGELIEAQARASLDTRHAGAAFECGNTAKEKPGRAAFDKLMEQLETAAGLPMPLHPLVVRQPEANAITLPGGYIYVFQGLIDKAETPDELAGVIAHEVGHVAHRDGTRAVLQAAGLSLLFGILLGDFVGGGAVVFAAKTMLQTSYCREVENAGGRIRRDADDQDRRRCTRAWEVSVANCGHNSSRTENPARSPGDPRSRGRDRGDGGIGAYATAARPGRLGGAQEHLLEFMRQTDGAPPHPFESRLRGSPSGRGASPVFALLASLLAIIIVRSGLLEIWPALATFAGALAHCRAGAPAGVRRFRRDLDGGPRRAWAPR